MLVLTAIPFSPWSEKARWALDHHQIDYKYDSYMPFLGEVMLRIRMRKPRGRVTVPVLFDGAACITDSFTIAQYADTLGSGPPLFPTDKIDEITGWNEQSEAALAAGRAIFMMEAAKDPELALSVGAPGAPALLKPILGPIAQKAMDVFIAKYEMREGEGTHEAVMSRTLESLEAALQGKRYLIGDAFSYADIAMAMVLQGIRPVDERYQAKLPGSRPTPMTEALCRRYAGLLEWRDEIYAKHRRPRR